MKIVIRAAIQTTHQISLLSLKPLLDHPGKHPKYYSCLSKYGPAQTSARIMKREQTRLLAEWFADVNHFWSQTENRVCCRKLFSVETLFMPSFCRRVFAARHLLDANPHLDSHPIFVIFMMRNLLVSSAACFFNVSGELVCFPANRFNPQNATRRCDLFSNNWRVYRKRALCLWSCWIVFVEVLCQRVEGYI